MRISDWSSDVCSSDLAIMPPFRPHPMADEGGTDEAQACCSQNPISRAAETIRARSEEHTSELQSLMRISYAVFCLKKKTTNKRNTGITTIYQMKTRTMTDKRIRSKSMYR